VAAVLEQEGRLPAVVAVVAVVEAAAEARVLARAPLLRRLSAE
jgi:hypothetical protein